MHFYIKKYFYFYLLILFFTIILPLSTNAYISNNPQALRVIGQYNESDGINFTQNFIKSGANNGPGLLGFQTPYSVVIDSVNHRLFASDSGNNRVLVYELDSNNNLSNLIPDYVLGQSNFTTKVSTTTISGLSNPQSLAFDHINNRLFVGDYGNNRVLIFDTTQIVNGENAIYVIGQSNFTTATAVNATSSVSGVSGLAVDLTNNRLFVSLSSYHRISIFDIGNIINGEDAVNVLGQANFSSITSLTSQSRLNNPSGLYYDANANRLFVADTSNNRVIVFDTLEIIDGEQAVGLIGQANFNTAISTTTQSSTYYPQAVTYDTVNNKLFTSNYFSHRVTVHNASTSDINSVGQNAIYIIGQTNFELNISSTTRSSLFYPRGIFFDTVNQKLYVSDSSNNRIMIFNSPTSNGEEAVGLIGQYSNGDLNNLSISYFKGGVNNGANSFSFNSPRQIEFDYINHRMFVAESSNHRVLIYNLNENNELIDFNADYVLGQPDFYSKGQILHSTSSTASADSLAYDPTKNILYVSSDSNRATVFNLDSITNGEDAINILGKTSFTQNINGSPYLNSGQLTLDFTNQRLFVAERNNHRLSIYDTNTLVNGESAVNVIGKDSILDANTVPQSINRLYLGTGVAYDPIRNRLFVTDYNRITVYDTTTITNGENAISVIGQTNFTSNGTSTSISGLNDPQHLDYDAVNDRLFVADRLNHRVLVFDTATTTNGENAVYVIGQSSFNTALSDVTVSNLSSPYGVKYNASTTELFVADSGNNRILVFDASPAPKGISLSNNSLSLSEGASTTIEVSLSSYSNSDVVLNINSLSPNLATTSTTTITFNALNWYIPQTLVITSIENDTQGNQQAEIAFSVIPESSDDLFDSVATTTLSLNITDNDAPAPVENNEPIRTPRKKSSSIIKNVTNNINLSTVKYFDNSFYFNNFLKFGDRGQDVKNLQKFLNKSGFVLTTDGSGSPGNETDYFGILTKNALVKFQTSYGIEPTGYFGPITKSLINYLVK